MNPRSNIASTSPRNSKKMEEIQSNPNIILPTLISLLLFLLLSIKRCLCKHSEKKNLPPSPLKLPIIGNLHQLTSLPHRNLHSLARKHGPLMLLHFGSVPVLIVSSADSAREILTTHDLAFANRPAFKVYRKLLYDGRDVAVSPYGEYWRQMKSIFVLQLLSNKRVKSFSFIREEETALFVKKVGESLGRAVSLSEMFVDLANDVVCRSAFGRKLETGKKFLLLLSELMELFGSVDVGDFIPWLSWISRVNGFNKRVNKVAREMDDILESVIQKRMEITQMVQMEKNGEKYFVDIILEIYNDSNIAAVSIDRDSIKALILNVFVGGTDTISTALEWAMRELLRHPRVMEKLQKEVRGIAKDKQDITNSDLEKMHYLKAVIKETFRCHPPVPLLVPRVASKDVKIKGYDVSAGTVVIINAWAIGRDSLYWDVPEKFKPERFLNSSIDFNGQDFELIPFGAGRRKCPGITYADVIIKLVLANLVQKFNWELPNGAEGKDLDMSESRGLSAHRGVPLLAVAFHIK